MTVDADAEGESHVWRHPDCSGQFKLSKADTS